MAQSIFALGMAAQGDYLPGKHALRLQLHLQSQNGPSWKDAKLANHNFKAYSWQLRKGIYLNFFQSNAFSRILFHIFAPKSWHGNPPHPPPSASTGRGGAN